MSKEEKKESEKKDISSAIIKKFGEGIVIDLSNTENPFNVEWMETGSMAIDAIVGRGLPKGRIMEMLGPEGGGKSSIALLAIAAAQKRGGKCIYIDTEGAFSREWAERLGVNTSELLFIQPDYGEQALSIVEEGIKSNTYDIIVVDSVAGLVPKKEMEGDIGDITVGLQARLLSSTLRKLAVLGKKSNTCVIFINQLRQKIGVMYGSNETSPGGLALKYYCSVRLRISRVSKSDIIENGDTVAHRVAINVIKNKVGAPYKTTEFTLHYDKGPDNMEALIALSISKGTIVQSGPSYRIMADDLEIAKFVGQEKLIAGIAADDKLRNHLISKLELSDYYVKSLKGGENDNGKKSE